MKPANRGNPSRTSNEWPELRDVSVDALRGLIDSSAEGMCLIDPADGAVVYANRQLCRWISPSAAPATDVKFVEWLAADAQPEGQERLAQAAAGNAADRAFASRLLTTAGGEMAVELTVRCVDAAGRKLVAVVVRRGADELSAARTDPLTGLADRTVLHGRLTTLIENRPVDDQHCAVLFIDVDGFKQVNDIHGHLAGDRVLCEVAERLAACVRADDLVARFGGDEFVVLLKRVRGPGEVQLVVERIRDALARPLAVGETEVALAASVGVAFAGPNGQTADELLDAADRAMYAAKRGLK